MKFAQNQAMNLQIVTLMITLRILMTNSQSFRPTIYDILTTNGLPIGLLPKGITNFTLNPSTNEFTVHLNRSCNAKFETSVRFDWNFNGVFSYGMISNLSGIAAKDLFLWFPVKGIHVDVPNTGIIYFDVGVVFKQFAVSMFEVPRDCTEFDGTDVVLVKERERIRGVEDKNAKLVKQQNEGDEQVAVE